MGTITLDSSTLPKIRKLCVSCRSRKTRILLNEKFLQSSASSPCTTISTPSAQRYYGSFVETEGGTLHVKTPSLADVDACISRPVISLSRSISKLQMQRTRSHLISVNIISVPFIKSTRLSTSGEEEFPSLSIQVSQEHIPYTPSIISSIGHVCDDTSSQSLPCAIGSYDIIGTLGNGTHGEVILASSKESTNNDLYAVKVLRDVEKLDFIREVSILKLIREWSDSRTANDTGICFLQKLREVLQNEHVHCLVLVCQTSNICPANLRLLSL